MKRSLNYRLLFFAPVALFVALVSAGGFVHAQPAVTHAVPMAAAPGKTIDVTLHGQKLDDPLSVWTSFPAKVEILPPAEPKPGQTQRVCKITLEPNVPVGVGGIIVPFAFIKLIDLILVALHAY